MKITGKRYVDYSSFIKLHFGERVQKISLDIGFSCPNRDGSKGFGGCTYCNNNSFNPDYCEPQKSIKQQLEQGIAFFSKKKRQEKYLAYFQAYTNTYSDFESLKKLYDEALSVPRVVGLVIGTRPDCISKEIIDYGFFKALIGERIRFKYKILGSRLNILYTLADSYLAIAPLSLD